MNMLDSGGLVRLNQALGDIEPVGPDAPLDDAGLLEAIRAAVLEMSKAGHPGLNVGWIADQLVQLTCGGCGAQVTVDPTNGQIVLGTGYGFTCLQRLAQPASQIQTAPAMQGLRR